MDRVYRTDELLAAANESRRDLNEIWEDQLFPEVDEDDLLREWDEDVDLDEEFPLDLLGDCPDLDLLEEIRCARIYFEACGLPVWEIDSMSSYELLSRYEKSL